MPWPAPGAALLTASLAMPHDRRLGAEALVSAPAAAAAGAGLLLGTTAAQAFAGEGWAYTAWLVAEAVAAVLAGSRRAAARWWWPARRGPASAACALFVLIQQGLLFAAARCPCCGWVRRGRSGTGFKKTFLATHIPPV